LGRRGAAAAPILSGLPCGADCHQPHAGVLQLLDQQLGAGHTIGRALWIRRLPFAGEGVQQASDVLVTGL
jgi:hypothetical protein